MGGLFGEISELKRFVWILDHNFTGLGPSPRIQSSNILPILRELGAHTVRDGAIEIGSARAVGLISEIEGEIGRSVGPISRRFL